MKSRGKCRMSKISPRQKHKADKTFSVLVSCTLFVSPDILLQPFFCLSWSILKCAFDFLYNLHWPLVSKFKIQVSFDLWSHFGKSILRNSQLGMGRGRDTPWKVSAGRAESTEKGCTVGPQDQRGLGQVSKRRGCWRWVLKDKLEGGTKEEEKTEVRLRENILRLGTTAVPGS